MPKTPAIASLALLKVNFDLYRMDYLDTFLPVAAECIRLTNPEFISVPDLQSELTSQFGLDLPQHSIQTILTRMRKRGYIEQESGALKPIPGKLVDLRFRDRQNDVISKYNSLINRLIGFCQDKHGVTLSKDQAENALAEFLQQNDLTLLDAHAVAVRTVGTAPVLKGGKRLNVRYLLGTFVEDLQQSQASELEFLTTVLTGSMVASALFLGESGSIQRNFRDTLLFFDTSFLIFALGLAGPERRAPEAELMQLMYETGADLRCFTHTVDEIRGILDATGHVIERGRQAELFGPSVEYFMSRGMTASDIEHIQERLEQDLGRLRVEVVPKPPYVAEYQIDEQALTEFLRSHIRYRQDAAGERAIQRDVDSLSAIVRLRQGHHVSSIETCRALFVTTNTALSRAAREFLGDGQASRAVPPCLPNHLLTNLLWLKKPTKAPDLPRKRIIADAYAAVQPDERLVSKYLAEVSRLRERGEVTADEYFALRASFTAREALMEVTLGEEEAFAQGSAQEILEIVKGRIQAEVRSELAAEQLRSRLLERQEAERIDRVEARALSIARYGARVVTYGGLVLVAAGLIAPLLFELLGQPTGWGRYVSVVVLVFVAGLGAANLARGVTIEHIARRVEVWLQRQLSKLFFDLGG